MLSVVTKPVTSQLPFFMLLYSLLFLLDIFFEGGFPVLIPCFKIIYGIFFYTSPLFRERHPDLQERIKNAVNRPYRTDSIMYSIMDVAGVETVNGVSYKHKSLFK